MDTKYKDEEVTVRPATRDDMKAVLAMIQELADFEKMSDGPKLNVEDLIRDGFESSPPAFHCLVCALAGAITATASAGADASTELAGYALFVPVYSTWRGRSLLLEDLYVRPARRRHGLGARLFAAVAKEALTLGCVRVDLHVLEWNEARRFYERAGAADLTAAEGWRLYRLEHAALRVVAATCDSSTGSVQ